MMKNGVPALTFSAEEMAYRQQTPLASALKLVLVEDYVDHLHKIKFSVEPLFATER